MRWWQNLDAYSKPRPYIHFNIIFAKNNIEIHWVSMFLKMCCPLVSRMSASLANSWVLFGLLKKSLCSLLASHSTMFFYLLLGWIIMFGCKSYQTWQFVLTIVMVILWDPWIQVIVNIEDKYRGIVGVCNGRFSFQLATIKLMHP